LHLESNSHKFIHKYLFYYYNKNMTEKEERKSKK
jgi:hypothetical protein